MRRRLKSNIHKPLSLRLRKELISGVQRPVQEEEPSLSELWFQSRGCYPSRAIYRKRESSLKECGSIQGSLSSDIGNRRRTSKSGIKFDRKDFKGCQVIYSQFGLAIHQKDQQARRRFFEWAQNEIAVVPDFHKRVLFSDEAHFWLNGYVNKQNCRIWSEANPQVYVETPLHPETLTVWCALWAGGILLQKR
ncbi:hypothetical protein TNCV_394061 [Trichonephila clavipes]|nr:hypothetical protein TNCV_394061 [Trichonephila clavipes]